MRVISFSAAPGSTTTLPPAREAPLGTVRVTVVVFENMSRGALRAGTGTDARTLPLLSTSANVVGGVGQQVRPIVGGRARDDAIVILGVALGFHQRLAAAVGAGAEVRALGVLAVEGVQDGLGFHGRFVNGAMAEVGNLLGVIERPSGIRPACMVTGVCGGGGVVVRDGVAHLVVADGAGEAASTII